MFDAVFTLVLGLFFMIFSFFLQRVGGALARKHIPASGAHRVVFFLVGLAVFIEGLRLLFKQ
jgi:hypothetical protein